MNQTKIMPGKAIVGRHVVNEWGIELGRIEDVAIDPDRGCIAYAVLCYRTSIGSSPKWFAIPWESLTFHPESHEFILEVPRELLEEAPGFDRSHWPEAGDFNLATQIYARSGEQDSWQSADEGRS